MYTFKVRTGVITREFSDDTSFFQLLSVKGINPPKAQINMSRIAGSDISLQNSAYLNNRNIVILGKVCGNPDTSRKTLLSAFPVKSQITIFYQNDEKDVCIDGTIESVDYDVHAQIQKFQVSVICPNPYFRDREERVGTITSPSALYQMASWGNVVTDAESGFYLRISMLASVSSIELFVDASKKMIITNSIQSGDIIVIDTNEKLVTLSRSGATTDITHLTNFVFPMFSPLVDGNDLFVKLTSSQASLYADCQFRYMGL